LWFSIQVVDRSERHDPPDVYKAPPGQKLHIDTLKPEVKIVSAERVGDEIRVRWEARDEHPDYTSLRLEYRMADSPGGQPVPLPTQPGDQGFQTFKPNVPGAVALRLQLRDLAGNEGFDEKLVPATSALVDPGMLRTGGIDGLRADGSGRATGSFQSNVVPLPGAGLSNPTPPGTPISTPMSHPSGGSAMSAVPPIPSGSSGTGSTPITSGGSAPNGVGALPQLRIVNKKLVKLDFEVGDYGPSGLGSVDVYFPVTGEVRGSGPVKSSVSVALPRDGVIYGIYLVVKSRAGLGDPPPKSGDTPQLRVELDTTPPKAEMYAPQAEPTRPDSLILTWWAEDRNLAINPITLEWASQREGPWEFIGEAQLPNTGRFTWQVPTRIPPKVYLRLTARDNAGNTAVAQTPEPILIDLHKPKLISVNVNNTGR
jgi:hypothetical protein